MISIPSMFSLYIKMYHNDQLISSGTGFLMRSPSENHYLVTNRHNLTGRHNETNECLSRTGAIPNKISISFFRNSSLINQWGRAVNSGEPFDFTIEMVDALKDRVIISQPLYDENHTQKWFEHPTLREAADFVALKIDKNESVYNITFLKEFSHPLVVGITETVSVIGYPFGKSNNNFPVWANGTIASDPVLDYNDLPIMLIDCRTRTGQSGSPVFRHVTSGMVNFENNSMQTVFSPISRFLGIYSGRIHSDSDIGIVWKASVVYELIDSLP